MENKNHRTSKFQIFDNISHLFHQYEKINILFLTIAMVTIIFVATMRVFYATYIHLINDIDQPQKIGYEDFQSIFGKIITLLIAIEFMNSIINVLHSRKLITLTKDVILLASLALCRKLIVLDYAHEEALHIIALGLVLIALGLLYFLICLPGKFHKKSTENNQ